MRVSVLSRSLPMRQTSTGTTTTSFRDRDNALASSASSVRNTVRSSSDSYASAMRAAMTPMSGKTVRQLQSNGGTSPARMIIKETRASSGSGRTVELKDRPASKLTPSVLRTRSPSLIQPSILEPEEEERTEEGEEQEQEGGGEEEGDRKLTQYVDEVDGEDSIQESFDHSCFISKRHFSILSSLSSMRPKSFASSVRSQTTVRKSVTSTAASNNNSSRSRLNVNAPKSPTFPAPRPIRTYRISTTIRTVVPHPVFQAEQTAPPPPTTYHRISSNLWRLHYEYTYTQW